MHQRFVFYRWLFYGLATALFLILQSVVLNRLRLWGIHPFLPPVLVAVAAVWEDRQESLCAAAVFGLLCDLTMTPPIPCFYLLTFCATAFLAGLISTHWLQPGLFCALTASVVAFAVNGLCHVLLLSVHGYTDFAASASISGRELLLALPLIPFVFLLFRCVHRRYPAD